MYINETTAEERLTIANTVGDIFTAIDRAHRMLYRLWEDHFESLEQKDISAYDAKDMGDLIYTIDDILFNAMLKYGLVTGESAIPGVEPYMIGAKRAARALRVEALNTDIFHAERDLKPELREKICRKRGDILKLPDSQAAPALETLLKEAEAGK